MKALSAVIRRGIWAVWLGYLDCKAVHRAEATADDATRLLIEPIDERRERALVHVLKH
jgi:hypothetical protein